MVDFIIKGRSIDGTVYLGSHNTWSTSPQEALRMTLLEAENRREQIQAKMASRNSDDKIGRLVVVYAPPPLTSYGRWWQGVKEYAYFDQEETGGLFRQPPGPQPTYFGSILKGIWATSCGSLSERLRYAYCRHFGHDLEDESYGNSETGCLAFHCKRCGWSHHETFY